MVFGYFPPKVLSDIIRDPRRELAYWVLGFDNLLKRTHVSETFRLLDLKPHDHVLEIGAGGMYYSGEIAKKVSRVVAIDIMDGFYLWYLGRKGEDSLIPVRSDGQYLPFADGSFDKVYISEVFGVLADPIICVKEVFRVLKPRGFLVTVNGVELLPKMRELFDWWLTGALIRRTAKKWGGPLEYSDYVKRHLEYGGTNPRYFDDAKGLIEGALEQSGFVDLEISWAVKPKAQWFYFTAVLVHSWRSGEHFLGKGQSLLLPIMRLLDFLDRKQPAGMTLFCKAMKPMP